ncbi:MAG: UbiD family decarboxylase [Nitrospirae bacterium]|nr:UbiD family decarboxylase [Nitrospirota bacterium]
MGYRNLSECVRDLERTNQLVRIDCEVDPNIEIGVIQRRVYRAGGPALLFTRVKGCAFPMLGNLFGTMERTRFIFRDALRVIEKLVDVKVNPASFARNPGGLFTAARGALHMLPKRVGSGPILANKTAIDRLPQLKSWPRDGGAFITLPQVYSESPRNLGFRHSNIGMYRVQISGNSYAPNEEVGIHYQIHRGIGVHQAEAIERGEPLRVNIFVGGPPSLTVAAVMPLPEDMPELYFAGILAGGRINMVAPDGELPMPAEADFCITGVLEPELLRPEGPFGDHLGYYSLVHDFPALRVKNVYHRTGAIWPFTTVGRPPQEDTNFGAFIHELAGRLVPAVLPGVHAVHAVDSAGVHPLLFAIGSERYTPYDERRRPMELLTAANAILGHGQLSLAKYLFIAASQDDPGLDIHDIPAFFRHVLERVDWRRDIHFHTRTTIDTLDYTGGAFNQGSKAAIAAAGPKLRVLPTVIPGGLNLPSGFSSPQVALPGVLVIVGPPCGSDDDAVERFCDAFRPDDLINSFPLIIVADDSEFTARTTDNFVWTVFTRSDPARDVYGVGSFIEKKHWGCAGSLVIDARVKPGYAPPLVEDPEIERRVDAMFAKGGALHGLDE